MKKILIFALSIFMCFGLIKVNAAIIPAYNIVTNPGVDLAHEVNINWHSNITGTVLEYTLASSNYENKTVVEGVYRDFKTPEGARSIVGFGDRYIVTVDLKDLQAGTKYKYRVGKDEAFSKDYYFSTAKEGTFSFLHITDPQYYSQATANIFNGLMEQAYTINPDIAFTFFTGDVIDKGGNEDQWKMFYNASNITRNIVAVTPGNHEYYDASGSGAYIEDFVMAGYNNPKNGAEGALNTSYFFRYNNTLFISINSEAKSMTNQKIWFEEVIKQNFDANFIVVGMHRSMYGSIYADQSIAVRANWQKLFDKYGVDLVLSGHDHVYARSHHIYNDQISTDPNKGTTYIIGGSGGAKFYAATPNSKYAKTIERTSCANIITISESELTINAIGTNGETLDTLEMPINTKRISTKDENFSKTAFEESVKVELNKETYNSAFVSWAKNSYDNVLSVSVVDDSDKVVKDVFIYNNNINKFEFINIKMNTINKVNVKILYNDLTTKLLTFEVDANKPVPIVYLTLSEALALMKTEFDNKVFSIYNK